MPEGLHRRYGQGHLHFITCGCDRRLPLLGSFSNRDFYVIILSDVGELYRFALVGYIVMPEQVHLLVSEPAKGTPATVMQALQQKVSRCQSDRRSPRFWQFRFYDFNVWSQKEKIEKVQYMHMNPVKRGLVSHPKDCAWSSFSFYPDGQEGLVRIDPVS
jgi:putative transposase